MSPSWTLILLTGGTGRRLGGQDKARLDLAGCTPLDLALESVPRDVAVVVAGDPLPVPRPVLFHPENPRGGGPAAGIAAAGQHATTPVVGILAVDMPWAAAVLPHLIDALLADPGADAAVAVDDNGRRQPLCAAWRTSALMSAVERCGDLTGRPVRDLMDGAVIVDIPVRGADLEDIDTPEDLARARRRHSPT